MNKESEFLLVNLESFEGMYFTVPGGGIEEGETLEEAVYRETGEELGIGEESLELIGQSSLPLYVTFKVAKISSDGKEYDGSERYFFGFRFVGSDSDIKLMDGEVRSYKWVPFTELNKYLLFDNQLKDTSAKILEIFPLQK